MTDRFVRQADLVPRRNLQGLSIDVIGIGAIGRQVALQLAALGAVHVRLFDFDTVELTNVTSQGYSQRDDVGCPKVDATRRSMEAIEPLIDVYSVQDRYRPEHGISEAVFCAVDSIAARKAIWRTAAARCRFWCDGRMRGEVLRILTVADAADHDRYTRTLFPQSEAQVGSCASHSSIYCASIAAGLMLHQLARWLRGIAVDPDLALNLLASELTLGGSPLGSERCK